MGPAASLRSKWTTCFCVSPLKITQTCWLGSAEKLPPIMMIQLPCIHRCVSIGWAEGRLCLLDSSVQSAKLLVASQFCVFYFNFCVREERCLLQEQRTPKTKDSTFVFPSKKGAEWPHKWRGSVYVDLVRQPQPGPQPPCDTLT